MILRREQLSRCSIPSDWPRDAQQDLLPPPKTLKYGWRPVNAQNDPSGPSSSWYDGPDDRLHAFHRC